MVMLAYRLSAIHKMVADDILPLNFNDSRSQTQPESEIRMRDPSILN